MSALRSFKRQTDDGTIKKILDRRKKGTKLPQAKKNLVKVANKILRRRRKLAKLKEEFNT